MKPYQKYICNRCGIKQGVKGWTFAEDGFEHEVYLCDQCAEDTHVMDRAKEYKQRIEDGKSESTNN